jgi:hypothetical protein
VFVNPVSHPFNNTTGGRVAVEGTVSAAAGAAQNSAAIVTQALMTATLNND